jgi:hypothetical protein
MDYRAPMNGFPKPLVLTLAALFFAGTASMGFADEADNPYRIIAVRNAFGLKPTIGPTNTTAEVVVKTDIKLTGIARVNGVRKAYLATPDPDTKAAGQFRFYEMKESRPDDPYVKDGIEVIQIDEAKQTVKVRQGASEMVLDFDKHGFKAAAAPAPPPIAGRPGTAPPLPGAPAIGTPTATAAPAPVIISRGSAAAGAAAGSYGSSAPAASRDSSGLDARKPENSSAGLTRIPTRQVRTPTGYAATPEAVPAAPQISSEEQYLQLEVVRRAAEQRGIPLPPTPPLLGMPTEGTQNPPDPNPTAK